jgi:hypothetical protein
MNDLVTRLLALAEKAVDEALQFEYGDPDNRYIYRELQELRQLVQQPQDGPTDEEICSFIARVWPHSPGKVRDREWREDMLKMIRAAFEELPLPDNSRPAIEPVPVSERMPGPEDCDSEGRCWWFAGWSHRFWHYHKPRYRAQSETHWLPYHALPLPTK